MKDDTFASKHSRWFARMLFAHPDWQPILARICARPLGAEVIGPLCSDLREGLVYRDEADLKSVLRKLRNLWLCAVMERDLAGRANLDEVMVAMTALAEFSIHEALCFLGPAAAEVHGVPVAVQSGAAQDLMVVAMGKLGGAELNVSSDIDLVFVYGEDGQTRAEPGQKALSNQEFFTQLGRRLIGVLSEVTADGFVFRVDMRLRPNGESGPLVASVAMLEEYFVTQGRNWERFAWIKARVVSQPTFASSEGANVTLAALQAIVSPFVYRRYLDFGAIEALRALHDQIRAENRRRDGAHAERTINVKLGRGGIREIEFIAQHFQLIRGGRVPDLRDRATLTILTRLAQMGLLDADTAARLRDGYVLLRQVEHRLQYVDDAQTHVLPRTEEDKARVGAMCARLIGDADFPELTRKLVALQAYVAARFDEVFGAPADDAGAGGSNGSIWNESNSGGASTREGLDVLAKSGYPDAAAAQARLRALWNSSRIRTLSVPSRDRLDRLMPGAIELAAVHAGVGCDAATLLGRVADLLEAIAGRGSYLALLFEFPGAFKRVVALLASSPWAARYLTLHPLLLDELLDARAREAPNWPAVIRQLGERMQHTPGDTERQMDLLRETHHVQTFSLLIQDLEQRLTVEALSDHLSALADLIVEAALNACWERVAGDLAAAPRFAVIAYGRLGGKELGYASDLDLVFLYDDTDADEEVIVAYGRLAQRLVTWLTARTPAGGLFEVDLRLRPEGTSGLFVTGFGAFQKYQRESAWVWEHQALTRARFCAGDARLGVAFEAERRMILRQTRDLSALRGEVARMRVKMHEGHPNRSEEFDLKHDTGGMVDIEFCVQFLVLAYASQWPVLLEDMGNIALLRQAGALGLIDVDLALAVANAYRVYRRRQHALRLAEARFARVPQSMFEAERAAVTRLFDALGLRLAAGISASQ